MSASAPPVPPVKGHCPECGPGRLADVVGHYERRYEGDDDNLGIWGTTDYRILQCRGCEAVYFKISKVFSEDEDYQINPNTGEEEVYLPRRITYWPAPSKRKPPDWSAELLAFDSDLA
jgi:hypothetical protein